MFISRATFEELLGPLQGILDEDRRRREHAVLRRQEQVRRERHGGATREGAAA